MSSMIDLNKLKDELNSIKNDKKNAVNINGVTPRDAFLNGLLESLQTGRHSQSIELLKAVNNAVSSSENNGKMNSVNSNINVNIKPQLNLMNDIDRENLLYNEFENKRQSFIDKREKVKNIKYDNINNINENVGNNLLVEQVKKIVDNYITENFTNVIEESIRSAIIEMYAVERIKSVLVENKEIVQKIVYDTIKELQVKAKQKRVQ